MYFRLYLESAPQKTFVISRKASMNFSKGVLMIIFKIYTSEKVQNSQMTYKNFFEGVFLTLFRVCTSKNFFDKSKNFNEFFEGCNHDYF